MLPMPRAACKAVLRAEAVWEVAFINDVVLGLPLCLKSPLLQGILHLGPSNDRQMFLYQIFFIFLCHRLLKEERAGEKKGAVIH